MIFTRVDCSGNVGKIPFLDNLAHQGRFGMTKILNQILILALFYPFLLRGIEARALASQIIYDDHLAQGWENWSWASIDLGATTPVHSGTASIAVTFDAWEGLYLHNASVDTLGLTDLRFYIHGGSTGGQELNVFLNLDVNGNPENGPSIPVSPPQPNAWSEVLVPLDELNPTNAAVTGITWQDASGGSQPTFYIDDISLVSSENPDSPQITEVQIHPRSVPADGVTTLVVKASVSDPQGLEDVVSVTLDASPLGGGATPLKDDGRSNDGQANDGVYGVVLTVPESQSAGERRLLISAADQSGHLASLSSSVVSVLTPTDLPLPKGLPQRIGWGSNAWSETPGEDWQVNSGVPWDYVYQYITYGWETWGGSFVSRFVHQAWDKGYTPVVTVYMMLGVPPNCGEGGSCYAQKLQNPATVQAYLDSLQRAVQEAQGSKPVIFNLEPDFYGYMQQLSNSANPPQGVLPDDPSSYPVALNRSGYANTLAGFGRFIVDMIHATASNALAAPMASMWATNADPQSVTAQEAIQMGQRTAAFIDAMGGAQADLLVVEWSDRDAGSGLRPWWDDADRLTPRPNRAILWESALSQAANKRLLLWQVPVGNMGLDNTCNHYQDNRAAYAFSHPRDLFDAWVIGVLFGGGAECMTQVDTDGGFVAAQGGIAYAPPASPVNLSAGSVSNNSVPVRWDENSEPDLWGYRILYRQAASGDAYNLFVGRRNAFDVFLPRSGEWQIQLQAVDAMGNLSPPTAPVGVTIALDAQSVFLPLIKR